MHKIVKRMCIDKFNRPSHSNITYTCEIFKLSHAGNNFGIILLASCTFTYLTISTFTGPISL